MDRKRVLLIILLLTTSTLQLLSPLPLAMASELVVSVSHTYDDVWMTESGNIFSNTFMVMMLDNDIGIQSFLRFRDLEISKSAKINYATLTVYVAETQVTPDPGSSVTIFGIDEPDCAPFTSDGSLWSLSRPYTSASVNWNTTAWAGYQSINVTSIVKEIINQYAWEFGNNLGLQILGASDSGQWPRSFEDYYHAYHEGQAKLTIVYDVVPGTPNGLPDDAVFDETYGEWDIWNHTTIDGMVNYTDMTQTGSLVKLNVFNETVFNWTDINKSTVDVALGYFANLTGPSPVNGFEFDFNFTMDIDIHSGAQPSPILIMVGTELTQIGSLADIIAGNEVSGFDVYTHDATYYKFLPRFYSDIGGSTTGNFSDTCLKNTWYMGKAILEGTLWRLEVRNMDGSFRTLCQVTLPRVQDINTIFPLMCWENVAGSQLDGWIRQAPPVATTEFFLVDPNGTVIPTWNGENFTDIDDLKDFTDDIINPKGGDPLDPDPGTQGWDTEGPFTRYKMRLYYLFIGLGCIFGPLWAMAYKRFDVVGYAGCFIIIVTGVGLLWSITGI